MTTHARGAIYLDPGSRAALDVGALHGRARQQAEAAERHQRGEALAALDRQLAPARMGGSLS